MPASPPRAIQGLAGAVAIWPGVELPDPGGHRPAERRQLAETESVQTCRPGMGGSCRQTQMSRRTQTSSGSRFDDALLRRVVAVIVDEMDPEQAILSGS